MNWKALGSVGKEDLRAARDELHWLSQAAALYALAVLPKKDDWSHYALRWDAGRQKMVTADSVVAIDLSRGVVEFGNKELDPRGMNLPAVLEWLGAAAGLENLSQSDLPHEMPAHPLGEGAAFVLSDSRAMSELCDWYSAAADTLAGLGTAHIWTHHFDMAAVTYRGEGERQVLSGLSPGDADYDEPYFYVTPWPHPDADALPELSSGHWHAKNWIGAILTSSALHLHEDPKAAATLFMAEAIRLSTVLVSSKDSVS